MTLSRQCIYVHTHTRTILQLSLRGNTTQPIPHTPSLKEIQDAPILGSLPKLGSPLCIPIYHHPYHGEPPKSTPNFAKPQFEGELPVFQPCKTFVPEAGLLPKPAVWFFLYTAPFSPGGEQLHWSRVKRFGCRVQGFRVWSFGFEVLTWALRLF